MLDLAVMVSYVVPCMILTSVSLDPTHWVPS